MDCRDFSESLQAYIDGELKEAERAELEEHLETCSSCSTGLYELEKVNDLLHKAFENKPPTSAVAAHVLAGISGQAVPEEPAEIEVEAEEDDDPSTNLVGRTLGGYKIIEKIGSGGMGTVYKALQLSMGRHVALKILYHKYSSDKIFVKRFIREARNAGGLNHPNIVRVYDVGQDNGFYFMSQELVEGRPLNQVLAREQRLTPEQALNIVIQTARALQHAHKQSVIHRDVKPENIIVDPSDNIKLADMGLAKKIGISQDASLTMEGQAVGTPYYMSPEQVVDASSVDHRTDIYSLGTTFYHLVTGERPFEGATSMEIMAAVIHDEVRFSREQLAYVPRQLVQLINKMTDKEPDKRYQTATELIEELERIRSRQLTYAAPASAPRPRAVRAAVARREREPASVQERKVSSFVWLGAIAAGLLLLIGLWAAMRPSGPDETIAPRGYESRAPKEKKKAPPLPAYVPTEPEVVEKPVFEGEAKKQFDAVIALMSERPESYAEQMSRLDDIIKGYPSSKYAPRAKTLYDSIVEKLDKALAQAGTEADNLRRLSDFNGAIALLEDFSSKYAGTDAAETAAAQARLFREQQGAKFQRDMKVAQQRLTRGDIDGATYLLEKVAEYGDDEMKKQAQEKVAAIEARVAAAAAVRKRERQIALLDEFYHSTVEPLMDHQYARVIEAVDAAAQGPRFADIQEYISHEHADIAHLIGLTDALRTALGKLASSGRDSSLRLKDYDRPVQGRVKEISPGVFVVNDRKAGLLITLNIKKLTADEVVKLTSNVLEGRPDADMKYYLFYLYKGDFTRAMEYLDKLSGRKTAVVQEDAGAAKSPTASEPAGGADDKLKKLLKKYGLDKDTQEKLKKAMELAGGLDGKKAPQSVEQGDPRYAICYEKFELVKPIVTGILVEHNAKKLLDAAKLAYRRKDYEKAQEILERLLGGEFADTRFLDQAKREEIAKLLNNIEARLSKPLSDGDIKRDEVASLFNAAKIVKLRSGKYRITYDFTTSKQLKDFMIGNKKMIEEERAEELFSWRDKRGFKYENAPPWAVIRYQKYTMVNGKGEHPLVWKGVIKGDVTFEFIAVPLQRYNVIAMLCHNDKGAYVLASSFKGGDADWHREKFGMTRSVLFRRHWDKDPHIQPPNGGWRFIGEANKMVVQTGIAYSGKAIKRGNKLTYYLNKQPLVEGADNTWQKGRSGVCAPESHVLYTSIRITGELDKDWIKEELKRLGLKKEKKEKKKKEPDRVARGDDPFRGASESTRRLLEAAKKLKGITDEDLRRVRRVADSVEQWGGRRVVDRLSGEVSRMENAEQLRRRLDELERRLGPGQQPRPGQPQPGQQPRQWPRGGRGRGGRRR